MSVLCDFCKWNGDQNPKNAVVRIEVITCVNSEIFLDFMRYFRSSCPELCQTHYMQASSDYNIGEATVDKIEFLTEL